MCAFSVLYRAQPSTLITCSKWPKRQKTVMNGLTDRVPPDLDRVRKISPDHLFKQFSPMTRQFFKATDRVIGWFLLKSNLKYRRTDIGVWGTHIVRYIREFRETTRSTRSSGCFQYVSPMKTADRVGYEFTLHLIGWHPIRHID